MLDAMRPAHAMPPAHIGLAALVAAVWGVNFVVIEIGLDHFPPLLFSALRFLAAALPAVFLVGRPKVAWKWIVAVGLVLALVRQQQPTPAISDAPTPRPWAGVRPLAGLLAAVVVLYTVTFRQASAAHDYWTFWGVAVLAVAATALLHSVRHEARRLPRPAAVAVQSTAVVGVVVLAISGAGHRSPSDRGIQDGLGAIPVVAAAPRASYPEQATLVVPGNEPILPWADFVTGGRAAQAASPADVARLPPDTLVFVLVHPEPSPEIRAAAVAVEGRYVLLRAGDYQRIVG